MMKTIGPPIVQANSADPLLPVPTKKTHLFQQQQRQYFHPTTRRKCIPSTRGRPILAVNKESLLLHKESNNRQHPEQISKEQQPSSSSSYSWVVGSVVSVGVAVMVVMGLDGEKAWAFGPEGPLVEEFWDNMRRYALYALTVSTGALYIVFQPILELLKNPISALLILVIAGAGFYLVSQVLSAMVGVSDFSYDYAN